MKLRILTKYIDIKEIYFENFSSKITKIVKLKKNKRKILVP